MHLLVQTIDRNTPKNSHAELIKVTHMLFSNMYSA